MWLTKLGSYNNINCNLNYYFIIYIHYYVYLAYDAECIFTVFYEINLNCDGMN